MKWAKKRDANEPMTEKQITELAEQMTAKLDAVYASFQLADESVRTFIAGGALGWAIALNVHDGSSDADIRALVESALKLARH